MEKDTINNLFDKLQDKFDFEEPDNDHQNRFLKKLEASKGVVSVKKQSFNWWKPLSIAASAVILLSLGFGMFSSSPSVDKQVAEISSEVSQTQFYFASLIEEQVKELENESTPETKKIIEDTMVQLQKLEANYQLLERDLLNGGNSKLILSAMITNFQTRIDLIQDVLSQVENIKKLNNYHDENFTI